MIFGRVTFLQSPDCQRTARDYNTLTENHQQHAKDPNIKTHTQKKNGPKISWKTKFSKLGNCLISHKKNLGIQSYGHRMIGVSSHGSLHHGL